MRTLVIAAAVASAAADFKDVNPNVFPADDPRAKDLPRMVWADAARRMREANLRESRAFAAVQTRPQWEAYRAARIRALRASLGEMTPAPKDMRVVVTRTLDGDGFTIHNLVYETFSGLWVSANLYLPAKPVAKMPGVLISHAHHTPKTQGELQDMGTTWARAGTAVLVPDHLGHGERRQHDFRTAADYPKPFKPDRQDYYFRYNANLQLSAVGESLMGWMVRDLMAGVDVLLRQPGIDTDKIILLGAVAGGGDPAGVAAALDSRIACVIPFNFGGWQPESTVTADPDRDFAWFGEGYWESTRGLRGGAAGGFAHFVIVGSVAPRRVVYAHEFAWDAATDPAWPRLQKIFGFYDAKDRLAVAHGAGTVRSSGPGNTHCTHVGATHRKMIYPALKAWLDMPIPVEYSQRRPAADLLCWTEAATAELKPKKLHEVLGPMADGRAAAARERLAARTPDERRRHLRDAWDKLLGDTTPRESSVAGANAQDVPGGYLRRLELSVEPGLPVVVPVLLFTPTDGKPEGAGWPVVVMVAAGGKAAILKERGDVLTAFLKAGVAVAVADVRGTGETRPGDGSPTRGGSRTSVSQTEHILGQTLLGAQLRDLRAVVRHLRTYAYLDGKRVAVWGDSVARPNPAGLNPAAPLDAPDLPAVAEPGGALLALLAGLYEDGVKAVYANGGVPAARELLRGPYLYVPHDAVVPGTVLAGDVGGIESVLGPALRTGVRVNGLNRRTEEKAVPPAAAAAWVVEKLTAK